MNEKAGKENQYRDAVDEYGSPLGNVAVAGDAFVRREDIENDR